MATTTDTTTAPTTTTPAATRRDDTTSMRAIVRHRYGSTDELELAEVPRPEPGPSQVLVRVRAAGVDRGVWHLMAGLPYVVRVAGYGLRAPKQPILGGDVAGVVEAVGPDVTRFAPGDEVVGLADGSFAEYAVADEAKLAAKPAALSFEQAAALPTSGLTALQALRDVADVQPGQRVLVIGASGGVGTAAVQLAVALGAEVTGVASTAKLDLVRSLGASSVIDYTTQDLDEGGRRYDVILDIGGNRPLRALRRVLAPRGTLVIVGGEAGGRLIGGTDRQLRAMALSLLLRQRLTTFISAERGEDVAVLTQRAEAGELVPVVARTYPLAAAADAVQDLLDGRVRGKAVLTV